jgi:CRP-like cAMP-binding protein
VLEYVLSHLHVKSYSLNEYIYKVNTDAQALYFITAGYVEVKMFRFESRKIIFHIK